MLVLYCEEKWLKCTSKRCARLIFSRMNVPNAITCYNKVKHAKVDLHWKMSWLESFVSSRSQRGWFYWRKAVLFGTLLEFRLVYVYWSCVLVLWSRGRTSAGFNEPGQCLHSSLVINNCRISVTQWFKYCFHGFSFVIQQSAVLELVQYNFLISSGREFWTLFISLTRMQDPNNSGWGIDCSLAGATLVSEHNKRTATRPLL